MAKSVFTPNDTPDVSKAQDEKGTNEDKKEIEELGITDL